MTQIRVGAIFAVFIGIVGVASLRAAGRHMDPPTILSNNPLTSANPTIGYRQWTRVNSKPHEITSFLSTLCIGPTPEQVAKEASNPHLDQSRNATLDKSKFVVVYVNFTGRQAMLNEKHPAFPVGSILVKEKLAHASSTAAEMLTAMRKQEKGYNPATDDWEYFVLNGTGKTVFAEGKLKNCESCHADYKSTDYVARTYLSKDLLRSLK